MLCSVFDGAAGVRHRRHLGVGAGRRTRAQHSCHCPRGFLRLEAINSGFRNGSLHSDFSSGAISYSASANPRRRRSAAGGRWRNSRCARSARELGRLRRLSIAFIIQLRSERSAARLAHQSGGLGVPSSNLGAPTIQNSAKNKRISRRDQNEKCERHGAVAIAAQGTRMLPKARSQDRRPQGGCS